MKLYCWKLAAVCVLGTSLVHADQPGGPQIARTATSRVVRLQPPVDDAPVAEALPGSAASRAGQLADFEQLALANNPAIAQAAARVQAARGNWIQVGLSPNPVAGYQGTEMGNEGAAGQQGGFVGQEFVRGGKLALNRSVAGREIAQAEQLLEAQRMRVINDVRIEFYRLLVAQRTLELAAEIVNLNQRGVTTAEKLLEAQEVSRVDVLQARVEANTARIAAENAENSYQAAWRRLAAVVGVPELQMQRVEGNLESAMRSLGWEESLATLLTSSPEVAYARAGIERARMALRRAEVESIPNIDVQAGVQRDNATDDTIVGVQFGMPIPIHNYNQGGIRRAQAELSMAQAEAARVELSLQNRLAIAFEQYRNALNQVERYARDILPDARTSLELVRTGYSSGEFSFLVLLTAQRTYFQTNLAYVDALRQLNEASIAIEGLLLTGSLEAGSAEPIGSGPS